MADIKFQSKLEKDPLILEPILNKIVVAFPPIPISNSNVNPTLKEVRKYEQDIIAAIEEHSKHMDGSDVDLQVTNINGRWGFARVQPFVSDDPTKGKQEDQIKEKRKKLEDLKSVIRYMNAVVDKTDSQNRVERYFLSDRYVVKPKGSIESFLGSQKDIDLMYFVNKNRGLIAIKNPGPKETTVESYFAKLDEYNRKNNALEFAEPYEVGFNIFLWEPKDKHYYTDRSQWGLRNTGDMPGSTVGADMKVYHAWNTIDDGSLAYGLAVATYESYGNYGDPNVVVALIDSGVFETHQDFDDLYGTNDTIVNNGDQNLTGVGGAGDLSDISADGHGTHLAGIIGARHVHNSGDTTVKKVTGVVPYCKVMPLKIDTSAADFQTQAVNAIDYVVTKADEASGGTGKRYIICIPWQSSNSLVGTSLDDAYDNHNILIVCAAGNNGGSSPVYPARRSRCLAAGAFTNSNAKWADSNYGTNNAGEPVIFTPGVEIYSTVEGANPWLPQDGTSCSAAFLAGAAAMLWSRDRKGGASATAFTRTNAGIKSIILNPANHDDLIGGTHKRLNLKDAVADITW